MQRSAVKTGFSRGCKTWDGLTARNRVAEHGALEGEAKQTTLDENPNASLACSSRSKQSEGPTTVQSEVVGAHMQPFRCYTSL